MIIGHAPAGYLWTRLFLKWTKGDEPRDAAYKVALATGVTASILPDFDMLYFYLVDGRQHGHHTYWTHLPMFWLCVMAGWFAFAWMAKRPRIAYLGAIAGANLFIHCLLDTFAARTRWFYPFSERYFCLVKVPAVYDQWILNFIFHWTFLPEIALTLAAAGLIVWDWRRGREGQG